MAKKGRMIFIDWIAIVLLIVGALNWGFVAWFGIDLVPILAFGIEWLGIVIYSLVALSGGWTIFSIVSGRLR